MIKTVPQSCILLQTHLITSDSHWSGKIQYATRLFIDKMPTNETSVTLIKSWNIVCLDYALSVKRWTFHCSTFRLVPCTFCWNWIKLESIFFHSSAYRCVCVGGLHRARRYARMFLLRAQPTWPQAFISFSQSLSLCRRQTAFVPFFSLTTWTYTLYSISLSSLTEVFSNPRMFAM